jgi:hypothetical protein
MLDFLGLSCATAAALGLLLAVSVSHTAGDSASGWLQVGTARFALKHVFAALEPGMLAGRDKERITVFLSDQPVPEDLRKASDAWRTWAGEQARAGVLHGVIVTIDPATGVWNSGHVLSRRGVMMYSQTVSSPEASNFRFERASSPAEQIASKVSMKEPMSGFDEAEGPWRVEADFRCAVVRPPAVTGVLTGAAGQNSPQYKAVLAFLQACRNKDLEAILRSVDPDSREELTKMVSANGKEDTLAMFGEVAAEALKLKLDRVTIRGDSAEVELADPAPGSEPRQSLRVVLRAGEWKIAQ